MPLISPNLHVVLIHYPLAMLIAGTMIELFSFLWPRSGFRVAGRWMILLGALSAIPAAYSGIYALRDAARLDDSNLWIHFKEFSPVFKQPAVWNMLWKHTLYQSIAAAVSAMVVVVWLGCSDRSREVLRLPLLILLLGTVATLIAGSWLGGESIYRQGVSVEPVFKPLKVKENPTTQPSDWTNSPTKAELMFPPTELHVVTAGVATAIALAAIGLSFRKMTTLYEVPHNRPISGTEQTMAPRTLAPSTITQREPPSPSAMARTLNPSVEIDLHFSAPAGRFWLLVFLIALVTALGGLFVLARSADIPLSEWNQPKLLTHQLWDQIRPDGTTTKGAKIRINRLSAHAIAGSAIVLLPLVMAFLARFAARQRIVLSICTTLLIAAVAAQVWFGVLLLYDTSEGPITTFNSASAE